MVFQWNLFSNIKYTHPNFFLIYFHIMIANNNKKKNKKIFDSGIIQNKYPKLAIFHFFRILRF